MHNKNILTTYIDVMFNEEAEFHKPKQHVMPSNVARNCIKYAYILEFYFFTDYNACNDKQKKGHSFYTFVLKNKYSILI